MQMADDYRLRGQHMHVDATHRPGKPVVLEANNPGRMLKPLMNNGVVSRHSLEECDPTLRARVLTLQVVEVPAIILTLIIVLAHAPKVTRPGNRRSAKRAPSPQPIALTKCHIMRTPNDATIVRHTGTGILGDDR